jgi:cation diffusion facilitator CzcD-associated flavoprotein CzcO
VSTRNVAVVGAGPCGLTACKTLTQAGFDVDCFEASDRIGGVWNVESGNSGAYRSLHTNTSTRAMAYSDFPFGDSYPLFPSAEQMSKYFESYVDQFGLRERIQFSNPVTRARPAEGGGWWVEAADGTQREYSTLVVATGQYAAPRRPNPPIAGEFDGEQLHVFEYLDAVTPVDCRGKRVVVVGLGSSAAELAAELSNPEAAAGSAAQVTLAARSGRWVLSKMIDGMPLDSRSPHPADPLPKPFNQLPSFLGIRLMRTVMGRAIRSRAINRTEAYGLPVPSIQPWEERPTMSLDFIPALEANRVDVRPGISRFDGSRVVYEDGSQGEADVVLYATGYELSFPFLDRATLGCDAPQLSLYQRVAHPAHDDLFFIGCCRVLCSLWPLAEQQSHWIAKLLDGSFSLPKQSVRARKAVPLARALPVICNFYVDSLRREAGGF